MEGSVLAANVVMLAVRQRTGRSFDGGGGATARRLPCERSARLGVQGAGRCAGTTLDGAGGGGRKSRAEAAAVGLMDRQTLRDWVVRFNAEGPEGLIDRTSPGRPPKLTPAWKQELRQVVEDGPRKHVAALVRGRRADLAAVAKARFDVDCHATTIGRVLRALGFSHISPRPRHPAKNEQAAEEFKKTSPSG